jgi:HEPN domain-containing protein
MHEDLANNRFDSASFFAQQTIEMLFKGLLIKLTGTWPITNFTAELLQYLAKTLNVQPPNDVMRCAEALEMHYIQARYPDARINDYRRWEAKEAIRCMEVVWSYVREVVGSVA